ncbi:MAG: hypothetical protein U0992_03245 [Planctomycetaceae bacterium]
MTAGNASMISGQAAAVIVALVQCSVRGRHPAAGTSAGIRDGWRPPTDLFIAPAAAVTKVVRKAGLSLADIDLFEINEAFAVQMLACLRRLELPLEKVNVSGGAIALGHPLGASGARILVTLLHALERRNGRYGVAALCLGGGNAIATVVERQQ